MKTFIARQTMNTGISFSQIRAQIIERFNQAPEALGGGERLTKDNALFIRDASVKYPLIQDSPVNQPRSGSRCEVRQEDLIAADQFSQAFGEMLSGGPGWVHANLISFDDGRFLVTLCAGQKVRNPRFNLNISYEPDKTVEIISTETLVTTS